MITVFIAASAGLLTYKQDGMCFIVREKTRHKLRGEELSKTLTPIAFGGEARVTSCNL
jgi:hypothetical protein